MSVRARKLSCSMKTNTQVNVFHSIRRSNATAVLHPDHPDEPALIFPPNTSVILAFALIQRDKELWGDDADEFRPERWMNRDREFTMAFGSRPGFQAFNIGPRIVSRTLSL